jgi:hypothetical protein
MRGLNAREKRTWKQLKPLGFTYTCTYQNNWRCPYVHYAYHSNLIGQWDLDQTLDVSDIRNLQNELNRINENKYGRQLTVQF